MSVKGLIAEAPQRSTIPMTRLNGMQFKRMRFRVPSIILLSVFLLGTTFATVALAQAAGGENAPSQSPVQVIVQIVLTAIVLRVLGRFGLP